MDDRQRQFAQFATALNQYAGSGDRGSRDRTAPDGRSSTGSTSSGSSNGSANAAAALWGELGRAAFPFNYSGWPQPHQGSGSEYHRYGSYGGFNDNASENRNAMENRPEGRRVPSKGETKATPPLPPGLSAGIGSTLASLQQLVGLPNEDVYRTLIAQQYAAAAALSGLPPSTHPQMSPIPPSSHTTLSPGQLHGAVNASSARHHQQQIDKHLQQQFHLQRSRLQQQSKSPLPAIPLLTTMPGAGHSSSGNADMNGEYLDQISRGQPSQLSPLTSRKERLLEHTLDPFPGMRQTHNPTPPKSTSISPIDRLTPSQISDRQHHFSAYEDEGKLQEMGVRGTDIGGRSGSESEGDQRARHKRKQDQPRRQSVIYSNAVHSHQIGGNGQHGMPAVSADSSSEDSQGYDSLLNHPPTNDPAKESIRNSSPLVSISNDSIGSTPSTISQAMSHVLSHPFVAAHLNTSSLNSYIEHKHPKKDSASSQYRNDYGLPSPHLSAYKNDLDASSYTKERYSPQYRGDCKVSSVYSSKDSKSSQQSYYRNEKDMYETVDYRDRAYSHQSPSNPNVHPYHFESKNNRSSPASHYESKLGNFHSGDQLPSSHFVSRDDRLYNSQYRNTSNEIYYSGAEENSDISNYRYNNKPPSAHLTLKEQRVDELNPQFLRSDNGNNIRPKHCEIEMNSERISGSHLPKEQELKSDQVDYSKEKLEIIPASSTVETSDNTNLTQPPQRPSSQLNELMYKDKEEGINDSNANCISNNKIDDGNKQKVVGEILSQHLDQVDEFPDKDLNKASVQMSKSDSDATSICSKDVEKSAEVSEPLINGDICENNIEDNSIKHAAPSNPKSYCEKISDSKSKPTDLLNGGHVHLMSPTRKTKKKPDTLPLSPDCNENKRSTRQKRPVSYVEDETDPVLEMNEDIVPLLSPAKKRGRKCKDKNDSGHDDSSLSSPPQPCDIKSINQEKLSPPYYDDGDQNKHSRQRELECVQIPHNISVPLHIDTSAANNYSKIDGGMPCPPSVTPVMLSPDIYDFNDIDSDGRGKGGKKRGRKRGSPKKVGRVTPEYLRTSLSPRMRDSGALCNKSPKFFTSNRIPDSLERLSICNDNGPKPPYADFSGKPLNSDSFLKNNMAPSNAMALPNPLIPLPLLPNSSSIVDEVEMQLAALHKEHIADAENRRTNTPDRICLKAEVHQSDTASDVKVKEPAVQKPMLSVVPLEQLTYEGMRKKNLANLAKSEAFIKSNDLTLERICKDPLNAFLGSECLPPSESDLNMICSNRDLDDRCAEIRKESSSVDRVASPSSSASSYVAVEEKSELDLSENIHIYNENFDSEGERNVIYTKMISRENCENRRNKGIFPSDSPSSHGSTPKDVPEDVFKDKGSHLNAANITFNQPNIQHVSVAEMPSSVGMSGRHVRGGRQRRRGGRRRSNVSDLCNTEEPALNDSSVAIPSTESNNTTNNLNEHISDDDRLRRRNRRGNLDVSPSSSPSLSSNGLSNNPSNMVSSITNLYDRVPSHFSHSENHEMDVKMQQNNVQRGTESSKPTCTQPNHNEAETLEDIAKFLEETAPSLEPKSPSKAYAPSGSSCKNNVRPRNNCETSYKDARPKRKSRPPPEMNDKEVNDLFLLLNMEDEESEDEDYIPKDTAALDAAMDSDDHESFDDDSEEFSDGDGDSDLSGDETCAKKRSHSGVLVDKESQNCQPIMKKQRDESPKNKKGSSTIGKLMKGKQDTTVKKKDETKRKWEDKYDGRGPLLRFSKSERSEMILNTPDRNFDQDKNKQFSIPFHVDAKMGKVGFSSTLHNSYDAFNKDLSWFCAFCKNFSHYRTLGDLFGPFFIKGLNFCKKNYPEVVEGQVSEVALSPHPNFPFDGLSSSSKPRNKKTPKHESIEQTGDVKKNEVGSISPPVRFVPSATPARMLVGRGGMTPRDNNGGLSSPRIPINSPNSSAAGTSQSTSVVSKSEPGSTSQQTSDHEGTECWLHEECILWSSGVTVVNSKLCGLDEAVIAAQDSVCTHCGETGATVCCLGKGCPTIVHVPCARFLMWSFGTITFQSFCPKHSVSKGCTNPKGKSSRKS